MIRDVEHYVQELQFFHQDNTYYEPNRPEIRFQRIKKRAEIIEFVLIYIIRIFFIISRKKRRNL